jgi:hypothetical protein
MQRLHGWMLEVSGNWIFGDGIRFEVEYPALEAVLVNGRVLVTFHCCSKIGVLGNAAGFSADHRGWVWVVRLTNGSNRSLRFAHSSLARASRSARVQAV